MNDSVRHPPSIPPAWIASLEGRVIAGKYEVTRLIGRGGMGTVWEGKHISLDQKVAIKFIHPQRAANREAQRRLMLEAKAAARLKTRHAVGVFDYGVTDDGTSYIVMEYLDGTTLEKVLRETGRLPAPEVAYIVEGAAKALHVAHAAGVIHRDLKPDNIFLAKEPEGDESGFGYVVKLVDFGIAKIVHDETAHGVASGATQDGMVVGTPHFMSPEALTATAPVGPATDLWSLGACAFAAMVGRLPFDGEGIGMVSVKVCAAPLPVPSQLFAGVPVGFDAWFARACHRDPAKRFQTAEELASALSSICGRGAVRIATMTEDAVQYELKPRQPSVGDSIVPEPKLPPKIAMGAGIVLGVGLAVAALGAFVYKQQEAAQRAILEAQASASAAASAENARAAAAAAAASAAASAAAARDAGPDATGDAGVDAAIRNGRRPR
jgi:serine/threonine protein kinase